MTLSSSRVGASPSDQVSSAVRPQGFLRRHAVKLAASLLITCGIVYTIHKGGMKFLPEGGDFQSVRWWTIPVYVVSLVGLNWFRSVRWRFLLRSIAEVPKRRLFAVSVVGFAAILLLPFRIGEIARPYMIRTRPEDRRPGEPAITMTAATSSVIAERIIDGLYLSIVLAFALFFVPTVHPLPDHVVGLPVSVHQVRLYGYSLFGLFCALFITIAVFYFARGWAHRTTLRVFSPLSPRLAQKLAGTAEKLADGLHVFGRGKDALGFLVETTFYWGLNAFGMWLLAWGSGVVHADGSACTFFEACALMGMLGCTILIPGPPGMLGVFQAGIYAGMTMYYPTAIVIGPGAAMVFLLYATQVVCQLALACWALYAIGGEGGLRRGLRELEEAEGVGVARSE
ncbi:MAG: flippase-like domain-containing protein [Myxococcales bacterium]|nr:flippase-like domain-containing protein [Myxococcales bacterium]